MRFPVVPLPRATEFLMITRQRRVKMFFGYEEEYEILRNTQTQEQIFLEPFDSHNQKNIKCQSQVKHSHV